MHITTRPGGTRAEKEKVKSQRGRQKWRFFFAAVKRLDIGSTSALQWLFIGLLMAYKRLVKKKKSEKESKESEKKVPKKRERK